jgi:hypothetical protein
MAWEWVPFATAGDPPRTKERWRYIYNAIRTSEALDGGSPS